MDDYRYLLAELDNAVIHVGQATAHVAAQEKRVALAKQRGDDARQSEMLLAILCDCLRHRQTYYEQRLLMLQRGS